MRKEATLTSRHYPHGYAVSRWLASQGSERVDAKTVLLPSQPFEGFDGLIGPGSVSTATRFDGNGVLR